MDIFKMFLDETCKDSEYKYERVESLAEIYLGNDVVPIAIVEYQRQYGQYAIRFRMGLSSIDVAKLTSKMTLSDSCLWFEDDFFIDPEFGYMYGDEARQSFVNKLKANIEASKASQQDAFFMSEIPLNVFGNDERTKYQKMWDDE